MWFDVFLACCIVAAPCHPNWSWSSMIYASNHSKCARWECKETFCTTFLSKLLVTHIVMLIAMTKSFRDLSMLVELVGPSLSPLNNEMHSTSCHSICPSQSSNFELVWLFFLFWTLDNVWFIDPSIDLYLYWLFNVLTLNHDFSQNNNFFCQGTVTCVRQWRMKNGF